MRTHDNCHSSATAVKPFREILPDGTLVVNFHDGQRDVWRSDARITSMLAGSQGGKTCLGPHWMHREIERCGEGDYLVGTATFPLLNLKLLQEYRLVFCELLKWGKYAERNGTHTITSNDGKSRIIFFSATNPESIESATAKAAHLDEAGQRQFRQETWEAVNRRLAIHQGRILITTTLYTFGWLKTQVYDRWLAGDPEISVIQFTSITNPAYPIEEFERAGKSLPPWKFAMFNEGRYEQPAGLVYDSFDSSSIIDRFPIPKEWPVYVGHDFGTANPAALFVAHNIGTGEFIIFNEYLPGSGRSVYDHVQEWQRMMAGMNVLARVGGSHQEEEIRQAYRAHGWYITEPRQRLVDEQIMRVIAQHRLGKIKCFRDCHHYLDEKGSFSYKLDEKYNPTDKYEDEQSYHLMAAERYLFTYFTPETVKRSGRSKAVSNH